MRLLVSPRMAPDGQTAGGTRSQRPPPPSVSPDAQIDVSVVLPCLNEAGSVGDVVRDALSALIAAGIRGEVIVSDNGSVDRSADLARAAGARVVHAPLRGYGNAYHTGMAAAHGRVLVMADADGTYPMEDIPKLVAPVLAGDADLVIGSRLRGEIQAMPWSHRYIGNPILTGVLNRFFSVRVSDAHSGMRAIAAHSYRRLRLATPGMEYASEMITQAARAKLRIEEVPIEYRGRVGESKLRTWHDGWRHLKFLLLASPTWLFLLPGAILVLLGAIILIPLTFGPVHLGPIRLILHPMIPAAVLVIVGYQMVQLGILIRACSEPPDNVPDRLSEFVHKRLTMERMLLLGALLLLAGLAIGTAITVDWISRGFGELTQLRPAIAAMTLFVLGTQTVFGAFLYACFLPLRFGGGVARPWRGNPEQVDRPIHDQTPGALASPMPNALEVDGLAIGGAQTATHPNRRR
jgi:glycosyltransferase involved in cell wall biosynthesis